MNKAHGRIKPDNPLRFGCAVLLLVSLAACADTGRGWVRAHTSDEQRADDYAGCAERARGLVSREAGVDADIQASRGSDWQSAGVYDQRVHDNGANTADYANHIRFQCMEEKGYHPQ